MKDKEHHFFLLGDFLGSGNAIIENPIVGLMIGIMGTVILQSSSTFTSIVISIVGGGGKFVSNIFALNNTVMMYD